MRNTHFTPVDCSRVTPAQLDLIESCFHRSCPEMWFEVALCNFVAMRFSDHARELTDAALAQIAANQVHQFAAWVGGTAFYMPLGKAALHHSRNDSIAAEFNGNNYRTLAKKHGITPMRVRQIMDAQKVKKTSLRKAGE